MDLKTPPPRSSLGIQEKTIESARRRQYLWAFLHRFGKECYHTWRQELMASVLVCIAVSILQHFRGDLYAWAGLKTALLASVVVLAGFAIWHLLRTPWLVHQDFSTGIKPEGRIYGLVGCFVVLSLLAGFVVTTAFVVNIAEKNIVNEPVAKVGLRTGATEGTPSAGQQRGSTAQASNQGKHKLTKAEREELKKQTDSVLAEYKAANPTASPGQVVAGVNAELKKLHVPASIFVQTPTVPCTKNGVVIYGKNDHIDGIQANGCYWGTGVLIQGEGNDIKNVTSSSRSQTTQQ